MVITFIAFWRIMIAIIINLITMCSLSLSLLLMSQRIESNQQKLCAETIHFPFKLIKKVILVTSLPPNSSADFCCFCCYAV